MAVPSLDSEAPPTLASFRQILDGLESRVARLESELRTSRLQDGPDPRIGKLRSTVEDLARDCHDQRDQLITVLDALETVRAGGGDPEDTAPVLGPVPPILFPQPAGLPRRVVRFLLRKTLGTLRRLWQAGDTTPRVVPMPKADGTAALPSLSVFLDRTIAERGPMGQAWLPHPVTRRTLASVEWVLREPDGDGYEVLDAAGQHLRRGRAGSVAELRAAARGEICLELPVAPDELPATVLETAALTFATEPLSFLHLRFASRQVGTGVVRDLVLVRRNLWHAVEGLDPEILRRWPKDTPVVGKTLALSAACLPLPPPLPPAVCRSLRSVERYFVRSAHRGTTYQPLYDLDAVELRPRTGERPALGVLVTTGPTGGVDRLLVDLARALEPRFELLVFALEAADPFAAGRWRDLERCGPRVYTFGGVLPPQVVGPGVSAILRQAGARHVLHVGHPQRLAETIPDAARRFTGKGRTFVEVPVETQPWLDTAPRLPAAEPDLRVVHAAAVADRWGRATESERVRIIPCCPGPEADLPDLRGGAAVKEVRDSLGLSAEAIVVTQVTDLTAAARPEDFVALAHRFRADPTFEFLLVGDGPLAGTVASLAQWFRLSRFRHRPSFPDLAAVMAASDIFCLTAESVPLPYDLVTALAAGCPAVVPAIDGLDQLIGERACGRAVSSPGRLPDFEAAIRELADPAERRACGERGRRRFEEAFTFQAAAAAWNELFDAPEP